MIIDNDNDDSSGENMGEDVVGTAYREAFTSADGFTRGPNGRVKFNKDTKKRRRENNDEDVDMADGEAGTGGRGAKRRSEVKFGQEFKAKVGIEPFCLVHADLLFRKLVEMSKRQGSIHMPTSPCRKRPKRKVATSVSASLGKDSWVCIYSTTISFTIQIFRIHSVPLSSNLSRGCTSVIDIQTCTMLIQSDKGVIWTKQTGYLCRTWLDTCLLDGSRHQSVSLMIQLINLHLAYNYRAGMHLLQCLQLLKLLIVVDCKYVAHDRWLQLTNSASHQHLKYFRALSSATVDILISLMHAHAIIPSLGPIDAAMSSGNVR